MKKGVVITNTARGAVMDEAALVEALDSGKVWSAGLDVYEEEPKIHPGLVSNKSVMLLRKLMSFRPSCMYANGMISTYGYMDGGDAV